MYIELDGKKKTWLSMHPADAQSNISSAGIYTVQNKKRGGHFPHRGILNDNLITVFSNTLVLFFKVEHVRFY